MVLLLVAWLFVVATGYFTQLVLRFTYQVPVVLLLHNTTLLAVTVTFDENEKEIEKDERNQEKQNETKRNTRVSTTIPQHSIYRPGPVEDAKANDHSW